MRWAFGIVLAICLFGSGPLRADVLNDEDAEAEIHRLDRASQDLWLKRAKRLTTVADAIRTAGLGICEGRRSPVFGLLAYSEDELADWAKESAQERWGIGRAVRILWVVPSSAADAAGLLAGDEILRIDGKRVRHAVNAVARFSKNRDENYTFEIERDGSKLELEVEYRPGCYSPAWLVYSDSIGAGIGMGAGGQMAVTTGLLRFVESDDELAVVIGHELGHHVTNVGGTEATEADADYIGLYFAARAGYDASAAPGLWERWGLASPSSLVDRERGSHPTSTRRSSALEATVAEIAEKRRQGKPLLPNEDRLAPDHERAEEARVAQSAAAVAAFHATQRRLLAVATALRTRSAAYCSKHVPLLGASLVPWRGLGAGGGASFWYVPVFLEEFKNLGVRVTGVAPSAETVLETGDIILRANGRKVKTANDIVAALEKTADRGPKLEVRRGAEVAERTLPYTRACAQEIPLVPGPAVSTGRLKGNHAWISEGMVRASRNDDELAFAIAHELGHRILGNRYTGFFEHELDADRLAVQITTAAGYDPSAAAGLLERIALEHPWLIAARAKKRNHAAQRHGQIAKRLLALRPGPQLDEELAPTAPRSPP